MRATNKIRTGGEQADMTRERRAISIPERAARERLGLPTDSQLTPAQQMAVCCTMMQTARKGEAARQAEGGSTG